MVSQTEPAVRLRRLPTTGKMLLHLIYIIVLFSCPYRGNGLRIVRDTRDIPTDKFKPIRSDDFEWSIRQRSSSSAQGFSEDNREYHIEGEVHESGSDQNSSFASLKLPGPRISWYVGSSDSDTTQRYDSWEVTTQPSIIREREHFNSHRNRVNSRRNDPLTFDPPESHIPVRIIGDDELITAENFRLLMLRRNPNHVLFSKRL